MCGVFRFAGMGRTMRVGRAEMDVVSVAWNALFVRIVCYRPVCRPCVTLGPLLGLS